MFDTFPWPQKPKHEDIKAVAEAAVTLRALRQETMRKLNYSLRRELFLVSCFLFSLAAAVPLFGLLRIHVTDEASKRAVHAFACRDETTPLVVDCSPNTKRRSFFVLCLRPGQTPLSAC